MTNRIDTDNLLDRCAKCDARARLVRSDDGSRRVDCTECGNSTGKKFLAQEFELVTGWNREQRRMKSKQQTEAMK